MVAGAGCCVVAFVLFIALTAHQWQPVLALSMLGIGTGLVFAVIGIVIALLVAAGAFQSIFDTISTTLGQYVTGALAGAHTQHVDDVSIG